MDLSDIRKDIDAIDLQLRELLMQRLDCSLKVAQAKQKAGSTDIYRADRERAILDTLGDAVPDDRRAEYLAVVRKIMESSRMYQYGILYEQNDELFDAVEGSELAGRPSTSIKVRLTREDKPNAMSSILCMIGDYGFNMERMDLIEEVATPGTVTFDLTIKGDATDDHMRRLLFQLSKESTDFRILEVR